MFRDTDDEFQLDKLMRDNGFIRVSVYSRFRNRRKHVIFIAFDPEYRSAADQEYDIYNTLLKHERLDAAVMLQVLFGFWAMPDTNSILNGQAIFYLIIS